MSKDKEPKFWVTVAKLAAGAILLIIFFGVGLYYTAKFNTYEPQTSPPDTSWGISKDSPIPSKR